MIPRLFGFAVIQVSFFFMNFLASFIGPASVSALANAWLLMLFPVGVLAIPFAEASLPEFSSNWAQGDRDGLARQYHWALRRVAFLVIPASVGLAVLAGPILAVLFERDAFNAAATSLTAGALVFYAVGLTGHGLVEVLARVFYSMQDTKTPVVIGSASLALHMVISWLLSLLMGINGLALGVSIGALIEAAALYLALRRRLLALAFDRETSLSVARTLGASALMGLAVFGAVSYTWEGGSSLASLGLLAGYMAVAAVVFSIVAAALKSEDFFALVRRARARVAR
jgi:putative peptidoglycan lipid II flippase